MVGGGSIEKWCTIIREGAPVKIKIEGGEVDQRRIVERNYKIYIWFDHIFNFSICSILAYEVDPSGLYFMHVWYRLKKF